MGDEALLSPELLAAALDEMGVSVRWTVQEGCNMFQSRRMSRDDFLSLLHSFAWQSPTLKAWIEESENTHRRDQVVHEEQEVLSMDDIHYLLQS